MPEAWITGANGLIGHAITQTASTHAPNWRIVPLSRHELELTSQPSIAAAFRDRHPDLLIHCAAASRAAWCEAHPNEAYAVNVDAVRQLTDLCPRIPFVFLSTDLIFDGRQGNYNEAASPNPLSTYGQSKAAAEAIVLANPRHTVIRASLNAGRSPTQDRAFNEQMERAWKRGETLRLFTDEFRSPIAAPVTARAIWELVRQNATGVFHLGGAERLSRYAIGQILARYSQAASPRIEPASLHDFQGPPRPPDTSLDCTKLQSLLSFSLPRFSDWIQQHATEITPED